MPVTISGGSAVVLQAVQTAMTNTFTTTATSFTDLTGMSVSITPSSTNSRILLLVYCWASNTGLNSAQVNLVRGSTTIFQPGSGSGATSFGTVQASNDSTNCSFMYIDSPATTSSTTYKLQCRTNSGTLCFGIRGDSAVYWPLSFIAMELAN